MDRAFRFEGTAVPAPNSARGKVTKLGVSPDGKTVLYGTRFACVMRQIYEPTGQLFMEHTSPVTVARMSPNGVYVATGDDGGQVKVWWLKNQKVVRDFKGVAGSVVDLAWGDDGKKLAIVGRSRGKKGKLVNSMEDGEFGNFERHTKDATTVTYRPTRPWRVATAGDEPLVILHECPPPKARTRADWRAAGLVVEDRIGCHERSGQLP